MVLITYGGWRWRELAKMPPFMLIGDQYEHLPARLAQQNINPEIPWLYNDKLDFRFQ